MSGSVRLHAFSTGTMTSALGGFLEGEVGELTYPVPVFVIEHPNGLVAVDSGLHPDLTQDSKRLGPLEGLFQVHLPADGSGTIGSVLRTAGFDPDQVDQVIVSHLHFDHVGGLVELPNARIVVQSAEWAVRDDERMVAGGAYNPEDIALGHDRLEIDGDHDVFGDGTTTCLSTDGHTAGHQSVRVPCEPTTQSSEQIIRKLAEGQKLLAGGMTVEEVCRQVAIAESTWARWLAQYGGMKADDAKRLKELEVENARLKKLLAEAELDKAMLKEIAEGNF